MANDSRRQIRLASYFVLSIRSANGLLQTLLTGIAVACCWLTGSLAELDNMITGGHDYIFWHSEREVKGSSLFVAHNNGIHTTKHNIMLSDEIFSVCRCLWYVVVHEIQNIQQKL